MAMKILNHSGTADTFTFPNNPKSFDDSIENNFEVTTIDFQKHHILVSGEGVQPKSIALSGHFYGTNKDTDYRSLSKHFLESSKLKRLHFEDDKFYLGVGEQIKKTHSGGRTNFVDYVATFRSIVGILLGNTQRTSGTNQGNVRTFIEEVSGTVTNGSNDITITDNHGNQLTIPSSSITTGQSVVIKFVEMVDSGDGIFVTEYNYATVNGTQIKTVRVTDGFGILVLDAGENVSTISTTNLTGATIKFRDGYSA